MKGKEFAFPDDSTVHEQFELQVQKTPDSIAVVHGDEQITYRTLNNRANQIARFLLKSGLVFYGKESVIAIAMDRSIELICSILGIIKAGASYVPIDPAYPKQRQKYILEDSQVKVILTDRLLDIPKEFTQLNILHLFAVFNGEPTDNLNKKTLCGLSRFYTVYTSGSTGLPKGVVGDHRGALNRAYWFQGEYPLSDNDVNSFKASICFIDSIGEIFGSLLNGSRLVVIPHSVVTNIPSLLNLFEQQHVTRFILPPSLMKILVDLPESDLEKTRSVSVWMNTGEQIPVSVYKKFYKTFPGTSLLNLYGASEVSADIVCFDCTTLGPDPEHVGIGYTVYNTNGYILDENLEPVPKGELGLLYVSGLGLSRRYYNQPSMTASRYTPNPFSDGYPMHDTLYCTGDLCRINERNIIDYIDRKDHQVKIRGNRVELGEVQTVILKHESVRQSVIITKDIELRGTTLLAYYTTYDNKPMDVNVIRAFMSSHVPDYMIPSYFVHLNEIPLTPNGKIDRKALPNPQIDFSAEYVEPQTPIEKKLVSIFKSVLKVEKIGILDNFFNYGGDSILSIQLASCCVQENIHLSMKDIFTHPTIQELAKLVESQTLDKPSTEMKANISDIVKDIHLLPNKEAYEAIYPATSMQVGMIYHCLHSPHSEEYLTQLRWTINTVGFDKVQFIDSWKKLIQHHPILRSSFIWDNVPAYLRVVHRDIPFDFKEFNWVGEKNIDKKIEDYFRNDRVKGFDLDNPPLVRFALIKVKENQYEFMWNHHHLLLDGWSLSIILKDFFKLYETGSPQSTPVDPLQYQLYAYNRNANLDKVSEYWKKYLSGFHTLTPLPFTRNQKKQSLEIEEENIVLDERLLQRLGKYAKDQHVTINTLLQAAWSLTLAKNNRIDDIIYGHTLSGRNANVTNIEQLTGVYINTLPIRVKMSAIPTQAWIKELQKNILDVSEYESTPLSDIQNKYSELPSGTPLFDSIFVYENYPDVNVSTRALNIENIKTYEKTNFPLTIVGYEDEEKRLNVKALYQQTRFEISKIQSILKQYLFVLDALVSNTYANVLEIPLVKLDNSYTYPNVDEGIVKLIEKKAMTHEYAIAVVLDDECISFGELNRRANQFAHYLIENHGHARNQAIGIRMKRSIELHVVLLGIWKANFFFVPIDPTYPIHRQTYMIEDSGTQLLITQSNVDKIETNIFSIPIDTFWNEISKYPTTNPELPYHPTLPSYIIYTSGSTGKPKGIFSCHEGIALRLKYYINTFGLNPSSRSLQRTSLNFDFSLWELWLPLMDGSTIIDLPHELERDLVAICDFIEKYSITTLDLMPSMMEAYLRIDNVVEKSYSLETLFVGGEALPASIKPHFKSGSWSGRLIQLYGPTETLMTVTGYPTKNANLDYVSIGSPHDENQLVIYDQHLNPLPPTVPGELFISGIGLAHGYWRRPSYTATTFVPNIYGNGDRCYRSGDLCLFLPNGELDIVGRIDFQVKIRGFRIELGEIENAVSQHPLVLENIALVKEFSGNKKIVSYIKSDTLEHEFPLSELRETLKSYLPHYMIPSYFVILKEFPSTSTGKADRKLLPEPSLSRESSGTSYVAPRTETEEILARIWQEILKVDQVGIEDNFFELGGDSILSIQVASSAKRSGIDISVRTVTSYPTISLLSDVIGYSKKETIPYERYDAISIESAIPKDILNKVIPSKGDIEDVYPLSPLQEGMLFHTLANSESNEYITQIEWQLSHFDEQLFKDTWNIMVERHSILRTSFAWGEGLPIPVQLVHRQCILKWQTQTFEAKEEFQAFLNLDSSRNFNLSELPLMRFTIAQVEGCTHLIWTYHHIILDGWSISNISKELFALYSAKNDVSVLNSKVPTFKSFVNYTRSLDESNSREFWRAQMAGFSSPTVLPNERMITIEKPYEYITYIKEYDHALFDQVKEFSRQRQVTVNILLQATWAYLLSLYSRESDVVFGTTLSGRSSIPFDDIDSMVGLSINSVPIRAELKNTQTLFTWISDLHTNLQKIIDHETYSLAKIQAESGVLKGASIFNSLLVYENIPPNSEHIVSEHTYGYTNYPISLIFEYKGGVFFNEITYRKGVFFDRSIHAMADQFAEVLSFIVSSNKETLVSDIRLTPYVGNKPNVEVAPSVVSIIETTADRSSDAIAVVLDDECISFGELNRRANQLAHYLIENYGYARNQAIGIRMKRSIELHVVLLGIWKANFFFVPIDPTYPIHRQTYMIEDSGTQLLITQSNVDKIETNIFSIPIDTFWNEISKYPTTNPELPYHPTLPAYILYTSGSTGKPKGIMMIHEGITHRMRSYMKKFKFNSTSISLQRTSLNFDFSVWECWLPLMDGSTIIDLPHELDRDLIAISDYIERHSITHTVIMPSMMEAFLKIERIEEKCNEIISIFLGGEPVPHTIKPLFLKGTWSGRLSNHYGPTEALVTVTVYPSENNDPTYLSGGFPHDETHLVVYDQHLNPLPKLVPGELLISGSGLSNGYWKRPSYTATTFIPNIYGNGDRCYRSGDLCLFLPNGELDIVGRIDFQVKIRGFRIELGEIENAVSQHPLVLENIALVKEFSGNKKIVSYIKSDTLEHEFPLSELRETLKSYLPHYMIPSYFVILKEFPINASLKVDRPKLPEPDLTREFSGTIFVAPRNELERKLARIWQEVLKVDQVGIEDNFFELGGDSILIIQIVSKASLENIILTVGQVLENQTISQLSELLAQQQDGPIDEQGIVHGPIEMMPIHYWNLGLKVPSVDNLVTSELIIMKHRLTKQQMTKILEALLQHHDIFRLRYDGTQMSIIEQEDVNQIFEFVDVAEARGDMNPRAFVEKYSSHAQTKLNLKTGPVMKCILFHQGKTNEDDILFLSFHWFTFDMTSWKILFSDLKQCIHDTINERDSFLLSKKTTSYKDYTHLLKQYANTPELKKEAKFWENSLINIRKSYRSARKGRGKPKAYHLELLKSETDYLIDRVCPLFRINIEDILLYCLSLAFVTAQRSDAPKLNHFSLFTSRSFRTERVKHLNRLNTSRTIGLLDYAYPVSLSFEGLDTEDIEACLKAIKEQLRMIPNNGHGYGLLRHFNKEYNEFFDQYQENINIINEVSFNFVGNMDKQLDNVTLAESHYELIPVLNVDNNTNRIIDISAAIHSGRLMFFWSIISPSISNEINPQAISVSFVHNIRTLIDLCKKPSAGGCSPSDFPLIHIDQSRLDKLVGNGSNIEDIYPLTPLQEGMLYHHILEDDSSCKIQSEQYVTQVQWKIPAIHMDLVEFKNSWMQLIDKHPIMKTCFAFGESVLEPVQLVQKEVLVPWYEYDYRNKDNVDDHIEFYMEMDRRKGFDMRVAPLMRFTLIHMSNDYYSFIWTHHHILLDGWSIGVIRDEFIRLYVNREVLPDDSPKFYNFVKWVKSQDSSGSLSFWKEKLAGFITPTPIHNLKHGKKDDFASSLISRTIDVNLARKIHPFIKKHKITSNILFQAAYGYLLSIYGREDDVVFGYTVAGRNMSDIDFIDRMVGLLINTIPNRIKVNKKSDIVSWLKDIQRSLFEMTPHEWTPLNQIQSISEIEKGSALFDSIFVFENFQFENQGFLKGVDGHQQTNYPLTFAITPEENTFKMEILYHINRLNGQDLEKILCQMENIIEQIVTQSVTIVGNILLDDKRTYTKPLYNEVKDSVSSIVEETARKTPDTIAVVLDDECISFGELNRRANQFAHYLIENYGHARNQAIGIRMKRSIELHVVLLGIWKANFFFVPIDPTYPIHRQTYMIEDSGTQLLITQSNVDKIETNIFSIPIDTFWNEISKYPTTNPELPYHPTLPAYILYTSGSTGKPKGAFLHQGGIPTRLRGVRKHFKFSDSSRSLQRTSLNFDFSVWELWLPLMDGSTIIDLPHELDRDLIAISDYIERHSITHTVIMPSMMEAFLKIERIEEKCNEIISIFLGGEPVPHTIKPLFLKGTWSGRLSNHYGPTEALMSVTNYPTENNDINYVSGGFPHDENHLVIYDQHLNPLPPTVPGELFIAGIGLAHGYWRRPSHTATTFIPNIYGNGDRCYRSGDLCLFLPNGELDIVGRIDFQVKIRGFRIELGEIENAVSQHPLVLENIALVKEFSGNKKIVSYIKSDTLEHEFPLSELRETLKSYLPHYMIPSYFVILKEFPINASLKVDRTQLPEPIIGRESSGTSYVAPRTETEEILARIWQEVLKVDQVGIEDNFFELGGDSILSIQVSSRAAQEGLALSIRQIMKYPTISEISNDIGKVETVVVDQGTITGDMALTPVMKWFLGLDFEKMHHFNQSDMVYIKKHLTQDQMKHIIHHILIHHDCLRLRYDGENIFIGMDANVDQIYEAYDVRSIQNEEEQRMFIESTVAKAQTELNLKDGPIVRFIHFTRGDNYDIIFITIHHFAVDGVSWRIIFEDLERCVDQCINEKDFTFPLKTTSFKDWSNKLRDLPSKKPFIRNELSYWTDLLSKPRCSIRSPYVGNMLEMDEVKTFEVSLSTSETETLLKQVSTSFHAKINDLLLTCFSEAFINQLSSLDLINTPAFSFIVEGHGRVDHLVDNVNTSRTVGWFTLMHPVTLAFSKNNEHDIIDMLFEVREQMGHIPNEGVSYGLLRYLDPESSKKLAAFDKEMEVINEISFNYLGQFDQSYGKHFDVCSYNQGNFMDPNDSLSRLVDANGWIKDGTLSFSFSYYPYQIDKRVVIPDIANRFIENIKTLIRLKDDSRAGRRLPLDYPLIAKDVNKEAINRLVGTQGDFIKDIYPLTPMQDGMLFHEILEPNSGQYMTQLQWTMDATRLDIETFKNAWNEIIKRHDIMRTTFEWGADLPYNVQIVHKEHQVEFKVHDIQQAEDKEAKISEIIKELLTPFNLRELPLNRFTVIKCDDKTFEFIWTHHHILIDGWSMGIITKEIIQLCKDKNALKNSITPPYRQFIEHIQSLKKEEAHDYWKQYLQGFTSATHLPGQTGVLKASHDLNRVSKVLDQNLTQSLLKFCKSNHLTANVVFQATWAIILALYSRENDVVFGSTVSGRNVEGIQRIENIVGLLINTVPVRMKIEHNTELIEWLKEIQKRQIERTSYESTPLNIIQTLADMPKGNQLFQSLAVLENYPYSSQDLILKSEGTDSSNFPLVLVGSYDETHFELQITHQKILNEKDMADALDHMEYIFTRIVEVKYVGELTLKYPESTFIPVDDHALSASVVDYIEKTVESTPDTIAVVLDDECISFGELNRRANQFAHYLIENYGHARNQAIGIRMKRSIELHVVLLGIWKANFFFVPIDPTYPIHRQTYMIEDSGTQLLITQSNVDKIETNIFSIPIDTFWNEISKYPTTNPELPYHPTLPAYLLYTSGSTGKPKGALMSHEGIPLRLVSYMKAFNFAPRSRSLQRTSLNFDFTVWECWLPLMDGSTIIDLPHELDRDLIAISDYIERHSITHTVIMPSMMEAFLKIERIEEKCNEIISIFLGGEPVPHTIKPLFLKGTWSGRLSNHYGPTEALMTVTTYDSNRGNKEYVSIGIPHAENNLVIYDQNLNPLPPTVPGELFIAGIGLAHGYWRRPSHTATTFIPNIYGNGDRCYRSGDLCLFLPNGELDIVGRIDFQVKIRGFRIELGEIENAVSQHPLVLENIALVKEFSGNKKIVSYIKSDTLEHEFPLSELRETLKSYLPHYMIPSYFVILKEFPINASLKVDRTQLPEPSLSRESSGTSYVAPRTKTEEILAHIWQEVLKVDQVGIEDNFFELGGDSILSIQISSRASQEGLPLTIKTLLTYPTISLLVGILGQTKVIKAEQGLVKGPILLTPPVLLIRDQKDIDINSAVMTETLLLKRFLTRDQFVFVITKLVEHHDAFRMRYNETEFDLIEEIFNDNMYEEIDISHITDEQEQTKFIGTTTIETKLNVYDGPILKFIHFKRGNDRFDVLSIVIHHTAMDGVSWRILFEDLKTLIHYSMLSDKKSLQLPMKTSSFKAWSHELHRYSSESACILSKELETFWLPTIKQTRRSILKESGIPLYQDRVQVATSIEFTSTDTAKLLKKANSLHMKMDHLILAHLSRAFVQLYGEGNNRFSYTSEGHGREDYLLDNINAVRTIGWFTSIYPISFEVDYTQPIENTIKIIQDTYKSIPHNGFCFSILKYLHTKGKEILKDHQSHLDVTDEISFNYLGQFDQSFDDTIDSFAHNVHELKGSLRPADIYGYIKNGKLSLFIIHCDSMIRDDISMVNIATLMKEDMLNFVSNVKVNATETLNIRDEVYTALEDLKNVGKTIDSVGNYPYINGFKKLKMNDEMNMLLTGVTGFLGSFLVRKALDDYPKATLYCHIRAKSEKEAFERLNQSSNKYDIPIKEEEKSRIVIVLGNLMNKRLGLSEELWKELALKIDIVIHNGSLVNAMRPYIQLKESNADSVLELIKFSLLRGSAFPEKGYTPLAIVSSLGFIKAPPGAEYVGEDFQVPHDPTYFDDVDNYGMSKHLGEELIREANKRFGIPSSVFRPGAIGGCSETGAVNYEAIHHKLFFAIGNVKTYPSPVPDFGFDWIPVNYLAQSTLYIATQIMDQRFDLYHMNNPRRENSFTFKMILQAYEELGMNKTPLSSFIKWRDDVIKSPGDEINSLMVMYGFRGGVTSFPSPVGWGCPNTIRALEGTPIKCPEINVEVIKKFIKYVIKRGFVKQ